MASRLGSKYHIHIHSKVYVYIHHFSVHCQYILGLRIQTCPWQVNYKRVHTVRVESESLYKSFISS